MSTNKLKLFVVASIQSNSELDFSKYISFVLLA